MSWKNAFPPLMLLATTAMSQPVGRLLDTPVVHSIYLRASPILHALDALGLIIRCLAYCIVLRISPQKALFIIGSERFPAEDAHANDASDNNSTTVSTSERGTTSRFIAIAKSLSATGLRLAGFGFGVFSLVGLAIVPGGTEARWTAAWGWMFIFAYVILEVAVQVYRWEMAKPQYTAADFELAEVETEHSNNQASSTANNESDKSDDGSDDDDDSGNTSDGSLSSADTLHAGSQLPLKKSRKKRHTRNQGSSANETDHEESNNLLSSSGTAANGAGDRDVEAEAGQRHYEYNDDPASDPKLPPLKQTLKWVDFTLLHILGWPVHLTFIYWAFLDLIQPPVNQHILAVDATNQTAPWNIVTSWGFSLVYLSLPFMMVGLVVIMVIMFASGALGFFVFHAISNFVISQLPESIAGPNRDRWEVVTTLASVVAGFMSCILLGISSAPVIGDYIFSGHWMWVYSMLSFEIVVMLLYFAACFMLYVLVKYCIGKTLGFEKKPHRLDRLDGFDISPAGVMARELALARQRNRHLGNRTPLAEEEAPGAAAAYINRAIADARAYLTEEGCALLAIVTISFTITLVWYILRFQDSDHWWQNWCDALQFINTTAITDNSTLIANGTLENSTAAAASSVPQPVVLW